MSSEGPGAGREGPGPGPEEPGAAGERPEVPGSRPEEPQGLGPRQEAPGPRPEALGSGPTPGESPPAPADAGPTLSSRRLHPAEIVLAGLDNVREIVLAAIVGLVVGGGAGGMPPLAGLMLAVGGVVVAGVAGYIRWHNTTYWVSGRALHFRTGVLSPDDTSVPLGRIHAIDASQGPVQRMFGVQELHVQTAGGGAEGEIVLRAVSDAAAAELRAIAGLPDPGTGDLPEWRLGLRGLLVASITAPQLGVILPLVGAVAAAGDDFFGAEGEQLFDRLPDDATGIVLLALAVAGAALLLSFLGAIVTFAGFSLVRDGDRLRIRRGLLARRAASVPLARVHAVDVVEGVLRRPFGLASVRMETAGYRKEAPAAQTLLPLVRTRDAERILADFVPALAVPTEPLERPPARSRRRYALPGMVGGAVLGAALTVVEAAAWPAVIALAALGAAEGLLRHRSAGWREERGLLVVRGRVVARRTLIGRVDRLQEHGVSANPLQRRARLADLSAAVGSGRTGRVRHLEADVAAGLFERLRVGSVSR